MSQRIPFVGGNWKMNLLAREAELLASGVGECARQRGAAVEVAVYPSFPHLGSAVARCGAVAAVGGQDCSAEEQGAYTGQVSARMLADIGCRSVLIGHSERRHGLGEDDRVLTRKLSRAIEAGLIPVLCVGETLRERDSGRAHQIIEGQLRGSLSGHDQASLSRLVIAYEPVWAIGTGRSATPDDAAEAHATVRQTLRDLYSARFSEQIRVIYGGSVNAKNAAELFAKPDIDGGLVGGASLVAADFAAIVAAAASARAS